MEIYFALLLLDFVLAASGQASCPAFNPASCNLAKKKVCCKPPEPGELCPTFQCLSKKYKSPKTKKKCNRICPLHCDQNSILCDRPLNKMGCLTGQFCEPKVPGCEEGFCPLECPAGKQECPSGFKPDGCPKAPECIPKVDPKSQCPLFCPVQCEPGFMECPGAIDSKGCIGQTICIPETNGTCPNFCPVQCGPDEKRCPGIVAKGCQQPDTCIPQIDQGCPGICPVTCPSGFIECSKGQDGNGCSLGTECIPQNDPLGLCPQTCQTCPPGQISCPIGVDSQNCTRWSDCEKILSQQGPQCESGFQTCFIEPSDGCAPTYSCLPYFDESQCPQSCYQNRECNPDQIECLIPYYTHCPPLKTCLPKFDYDGCPTQCQPTCDSNEQICTRLRENSTKCVEQFCSPYSDDQGCQLTCPDLACRSSYEQKCSQQSYNANCPEYEICSYKGSPTCPYQCPLQCYLSNQQECYQQLTPNCSTSFCHPTLDDQGCHLSCPNITCHPDFQQKCIQPGLDGCPDNEHCAPLTDYESGCSIDCPITCDEGFRPCKTVVNIGSTCKAEQYCHPIYDENLCYQTCPNLTCPSYAMKCTSNGSGSCPATEFCYPKEGFNGCPNHCPAYCGADETYCNGSSTLDENGCPGQDLCVPAGQTCPGSIPA